MFTRSGSTWTQQGAKLTAKAGEESAEGEFGFSVALSSEGTTAVMGGPHDSEGVGAAWVFTRSGSTWTQQGSKLTGSEEIGAGQFGSSVALSSEGNTALSGGSADNNNIGAAWVFVNTAPTVVTKAATSLAQTTATLNATVNPDGGTVSECKFEYGTTEAYGSTASCASLPGSGNSPVAVSAAVTGLTANTTYHFRISATNPGGTSKGQDETLKTPPNAPTVVTVAASSLTQTSATLNATVNPNGGEVSECKFEYGTTEAYGSTASCASLPGSGDKPGRGLRCGHGPHREHHLPLQDLGDQRQRHEQRLRPDVQNAAEPPDGRNESGVGAHPDHGDAERDGEPQRRGSQRMQIRIRHHGSLRIHRVVRLAAGVRTSPVAVSAAVTGLTANTTYHFRISATNAGGTSKGSDQTFKTLPNAPTVVTEAASSVTQTTATLNATVNPNGGEVSECKFEYGTTEAYGSSASCASLPGSGNSPVAVSAAVTGLTANTTYHFRISATNAGGTSKGSDQTFKTLPNPPTVVTEAASSVTQTTATLNATVNPNGGEVSECKFEYGTTTAYGSSAPCALAAGVGDQPGRGVRGGHGPYREHHLPLQDLRDQRGRHEQRLRPDVQNAAQPPDGRDETGVVGHPDLGDAERDGEPQRRGSQRMQVRIRHHDRLRVERAVRLAAGVGDQPGRGVRGGHGPQPRTPPTTSGSPRPTRAARAKAQTRRSKRCPTPRRS